MADAYAPSKSDVVAHWLRSCGHAPRRVLMVGDTNHDEEIADELGVGGSSGLRGGTRSRLTTTGTLLSTTFATSSSTCAVRRGAPASVSR